MKLLLITHYFSFVTCFPAPAVPRISADVDFSHQSEELRRCISETTNHYIDEMVAMGGSRSDRLPFSISQIQQLCIATATSYQISETTDPPQTTQFITEISIQSSTTFVQPATVTFPHILVDTSSSTTMTTPINGIDTVINLLEELQSFKNMLNP